MLRSGSAESVAGMSQYTFVEFFAGGGMARAGLGGSWRCLFANDFDRKKVSTYEANWGAGDIKLGDVAEPDLGGFTRHDSSTSPGLPFRARTFRSPGTIAAWAANETSADPFGHLLAVLETDARPRASRPRATNDRS